LIVPLIGKPVKAQEEYGFKWSEKEKTNFLKHFRKKSSFLI